MDRGELSETIVHELGALFEAEVRAAGPALLAADLDGMEQRVQQLSRRVCGVLLERVVAVRAPAPAARPPCPACGGLLRLVERTRGRHLQGLTGDLGRAYRITVQGLWSPCMCSAMHSRQPAASSSSPASWCR
jgi:hypothetical protein